MVRRAARSRVRRKKGAIVRLYTDPPAGSVVVCLDEMGPESAKSVPGARLLKVDPDGVGRSRATQEIDYGRRGRGYIFGAFVPATGETLTAPAAGRTTANFVAFLEQIEAWLDPGAVRVYAVLDNLSAHRAVDVLLWALTHPRWEFVFQPTYAAYLNLIEPWWKALRSLALKGRRFETWAEICRAVEAATQYWNAHRHPFVWGRRKRRRPARAAGIAGHPVAA
jgi:transposase